MKIPDRKELRRLADLAASLVVNCHRAEREARPSSKWDDVQQALDGVGVILVRKRIMQGDLKSVATLLVRPQSRAACAMTFLAEIEQYFDPEEMRELRELWNMPPLNIVERSSNCCENRTPTRRTNRSRNATCSTATTGSRL